MKVIFGWRCLYIRSKVKFDLPRCVYDACLPQTHPNVDKSVWNSEGLLGLKQPNKPFPLKQEIGVLKWRMQTSDESLMPLSG